MKKLFLFAICAVALTACEKDNGGDNGGKSVPDPAGTITVNLADGGVRHSVDLTPWTGDYCPTGGSVTLGWYKPDNIYIYNSYIGGSSYDGVSYYYTGSSEMVDIGPVRGLGNVRKAPAAGWSDDDIACEVGHGYIVRISGKSHYKRDPYYYFDGTEEDYWEETTYIRLYVVESIVNTSGGIMGAKVKYQYPFIPE